MSGHGPTKAAAKSGHAEFLTVTEASNRILDGSLSPITLLETYLERIEVIDEQIHSFIHVDALGARKAAKTAVDEIAAGK